jgi:16S rRNA (cytosine967-C5)-methyltransferase
LELETHLSYCLGIDIEARRLPKVKDNCRRLDLDATIQLGDASDPNTWWDGIAFDRILIDAPCSATGIIRRHPDIKLLRTAEDIVRITALQQNILNALWPLLAPNGILVYATCSILPDENETQIASFIAKHPDATATITPQLWGQFTGHGWQILPGQQAMDGFFYAQITKSY